MGATVDRGRRILGAATAASRRVGATLGSGARALAPRLPRGPAAVRFVALAAVLFWTAFVTFIALARFGGDLRALLCIGDRVYHPPAFASVPANGPAGYDGQQYAALATDPLLRMPETVKALDAPAYRATRFLVPLSAWVLALARPEAALITYQLLCWGLALAAVVLAAHWLQKEGHSPWWALPLAGGAGLVASMMRSTPDAAAVFLLMLALWLHERGRHAPALLAAVAAVLTRETSYLAVLALSFDHVRRREYGRAAALVSLPVGLLAAWQLHLKAVLGDRFVENHGNFTFPFAWLPEKLPTLLEAGKVQWQETLGVAAILATTLALVVVVLRPSTWTPLELTFLAFGALGLFLTWDVYIETWGYARVLLALPILGAVIAERQPSAFRRWALRAVPLLYLASGLLMVHGEEVAALRGRTVPAALRDGLQPKAPGNAGRPEGVTVMVAFPIANAEGRAGALWRTRMVMTNMAPGENQVLIGLLPEGASRPFPQHRTIALAPGQSREWKNAAGELFGFAGSAAIYLVPGAGPIAAGFVTGDARLGDSRATPLPAVEPRRALPPGDRAAFRGLDYEPDPKAAVRTNIGLMNVARLPLRARIEAYDGAGRRVGTLVEIVRPWGFVQVDDLFRLVGSGRVTGGWATVEALSPTPFLTYASVIRGPRAPVSYILPEGPSSPASPPAR